MYKSKRRALFFMWNCVKGQVALFFTKITGGHRGPPYPKVLVLDV